MLMKSTFLISLYLIVSQNILYANDLKPGFSKTEYLEMLKLYSWQSKEDFSDTASLKSRFRLAYRSPIVGLQNRWDLCLSNDSVAVIDIRGTVGNSTSWLENFYSAMVPASGSITLSNNFVFNYHLADNPRAAVHAGWLLGTGFLASSIVSKIDSCVSLGFHNFIITGHSQGGAIAYLMTSHLLHLQKTGYWKQKIQFKTYCSAAPKPGNLYYAYDYESDTYGGWAFNVVNTADWVPEVPFTTQTTSDYNPTNPFTDVQILLGKQKPLKRLVLKYMYKRLTKPSKKAVKRHQKYLGKMASKYVKGNLPTFIEPTYYNSMNYSRAGSFVVLKADADYFGKYPEKDKNIFIHHMLKPYAYLVRKLPD